MATSGRVFEKQSNEIKGRGAAIGQHRCPMEKVAIDSHPGRPPRRGAARSIATGFASDKCRSRCCKSSCAALRAYRVRRAK
jgi:hypothetical protein